MAAAREAVAEQGPDVSLDDIARRAGVGNATLYRHFPTRDSLLVEVYSADVGALRDAARELLETKNDGQALRAWLGLLVDYLASRQGLASASLSTVVESEDFVGNWHEPLEATLAELLADARAHDTARADVKPAELFIMANAIATAVESAADGATRALDIAFDGITPR
ncbi:TetR/AcrR family transcriptional regulator [Streptomyces sp. bgisy027]|uniref:TetR/AcrR family transcriptional regulator n=1 Tax=unclassified Streptomyces TaxID=2593676 RepID=UPI003D716DA5